MKYCGFWWPAATLAVVTTFLVLTESAPDGNVGNKKKSGIVPVRNSLRLNRTKFPLQAEENRRKSKRAGECRLSKNVYEIGESWSPDLGEPFGTMYCIECSCEPVQRKRRVVGRIKCRNVKGDCPKLDCDDAISMPGKCCKTCPEQFKNSENITADGLSTDEVDSNENNKEYSALLTPRSSSLIKSSTGLGEPLLSGLASGRFMFLHKSLYYSFTHNKDMVRPKYVQFVDSEGNVVEEQEVSENAYQQDTKKICGVWHKIPRVYRKLLKDEKLFAALVTEKFNGDNDRFLAGRVSKQRYVTTELYSALLEPASQVGTGGMAVITISSSTGSIYLNTVFNGDFQEDRDITIAVRIADASGSGVEEFVKIPKIQYETNSIEVRTILEMPQLQSLTRGSLFIVVYSPKNPNFKLIGFIQPRASCDIFDTILTPEDTQVVSAGVAWVYPLPDGSWSYNMQLPEEHYPISVTMETGRKVLEELPLNLSKNITGAVVSGMTSRYYQLLYEGSLYLNVATSKSNLRGRLVYRGFGDAQLSDGPMILTPGNKTQKAPKAQGLIWIGIDSDCAFNYQLTLSERPQSEMLRLEVMEMPGLHRIGLPVRTYELAEFEASDYEGTFSDIQKFSFAHVKAGDALFKVVGQKDSSILASAVIKNIRVPSNCLPNNVVNPDYTLELDDEMALPATNYGCYNGGKLHEEYSQWTPENDTCQICTCYKGEVKCEAVICPVVDCVNPVFLTGECCRTCLGVPKPINNNESGCKVEGDRFHPGGSSWHPYMPPNGFMVCTTCTCNADTLTVECTREKCPTLSCAPEEAVYPRALACCKVCPPKKTVEEIFMDERDQKKGPSEAEILAAGGCKFRQELHTNGEEWNHRLEPFGFIPCVVCTCRNGDTKCEKKKCPQLNCEVKVMDESGCCHKCSDIPVVKHQHSGGSGSSSKSSFSSSTNLTSRYRKPPPVKHRAKQVSQ
ncbi:unnamed protein product [Allacma fusca]|uniref:Chordin n=1 Tax=Allacma fusca TaxID=39272 RepID=A0A8J2KKW2_9HEXA|nr:unnamed protein product [Allacma fusca]